MLKMLLDPMGGILLTNDGNAILREVDVSHPAAKSMIELSRAQDEEVGDGTTSVIVLAGEMLVVAEPFITKNIHPIMIVRGYYQAMEECLRQLDKLAIPININDEQFMMKLIQTTVGTKFISRYGDTMCRFALQAVKYVCIENNGKKEIDLKRYAKVEKVYIIIILFIYYSICYFKMMKLYKYIYHCVSEYIRMRTLFYSD